jgi:hypothetical protein
LSNQALDQAERIKKNPATRATNRKPTRKEFMAMLPDLDTAAAVSKAGHELVLKRAETRARLLAAIESSRSASASSQCEAAIVRWVRLTRSVGPLRWVLRTAHA